LKIPTAIDDSDVERACRRIVHALALHTDRGEYDLALALFTEDAVMERDGEQFVGMAALRAAYASRPMNRLTRHVISNTLVRSTGPDSAEATSYVTVYRVALPPTKHVPPYPVTGPDVLGEHHDTFRRTEAGWRLSARVTRTILRLGQTGANT